MKKEKLQLTPQKYKGSQRLLQATVCQENGQPGRNGQILRKVQPSKTKPGRIENMSRPITSNEIETVVKIFQQTKVLDQMTSQVNSIKHLEKS